MDKLIELLNEYTRSSFVKFEDGCFKEPYMGEDGRWDSTTEVISKEYGFIKWLVENYKIDIQNLITYMNGTSLTFNKVPSAGVDKTWNKFYEECLLMLLAIQDNPIDFLIKCLK